ncbi:MAG: prepilin-type N-terminal cleavage/methylation domain-containing protein [Candidatus Moranbacteria bacterium]|nr:prepilin-type N-terminal cleavage/methylation domain-containing protein [Candidatus Moranbacteria bacterium]
MILSEQKNKARGFSLVEVLLAGGLIALLVTAFAGAFIYGRESSMLAGNRNRAVAIAEEGMEAARNIRDNSFSDLAAGSHGLDDAGGSWNLSGGSDTVDIYERIITISDVDPDTKEVVSVVSWQQNPQRTGEVQLVSRFNNWQETQEEGSCDAFAVEEGYLSGTCRQNSNRCDQNNEDHLEDGDEYCGGPPDDTCCALGENGGGGTIASCDAFAVEEGYLSGTCRQNSDKCRQYNEDHLSGGDQYCGGPPNDTCCGQ